MPIRRGVGQGTSRDRHADNAVEVRVGRSRHVRKVDTAAAGDVRADANEICDDPGTFDDISQPRVGRKGETEFRERRAVRVAGRTPM